MKIAAVSLILLYSVLTLSCSNNTIPDISGTYLLPDDGCALRLTLFKETDGYSYYFKTATMSIEGTAEVYAEDDSCFIVFEDLSADNEDIRGVLKDSLITFSNPANVENKGRLFQCTEKEFKFEKQAIFMMF